MKKTSDQYITSQNLETRMNIYQYSTNPKTLQRWVSEQIGSINGLSVLELGCGTGELWKELDSFQTDCKITLTDLSPGMLEKAKSNLGIEKYEFEIADFHQLSYSNQSFDLLISNHNLYHSVDLGLALSEISRVLKDNGIFYTTTNSNEHLLGLRTLLNIEDDNMWPNAVLTAKYGAETGGQILSKYFDSVEQRIYQNELRISDFDSIVKYFKSVADVRVHELLASNINEIEKRFLVELSKNGYFQVFTKVCLFICKDSKREGSNI